MEATRLSSDMISNLPAPVIESILCLVPIQEAARTSILSRDWRYHWTKIPKLVFIRDEASVSYKIDFVKLLSQANRKLFYAINQVMSMHEGPIEEFSVSMFVDGRCVEIDHVIDHLSRNNAVKTLALDTRGYWLPESLFSLHKLTNLYLRCCDHFDVQPTFNGFRSLSNLYMENVITTKKMLLLFLSRCPLLKIVNLDVSFGPMPAAATADDSTLVELLDCLPLIEHLSISHSMMKYFSQGRVPKKLPATLVHLKYLCIRDVFVFRDKDRIACYTFLIRSSPNLEKLKLKICSHLHLETTWEDYSDIWLEHLNEIVIENRSPFSILNLEFVKLIMAKSPVLKKVRITLFKKASREDELMIYRSFLRSQCASPAVQFIVERGLKSYRKPFHRV